MYKTVKVGGRFCRSLEVAGSKLRIPTARRCSSMLTIMYVIIPASNVDSRAAKLDNVTAWCSTNNLTLNRCKSVEIVLLTRGVDRSPVSRLSSHRPTSLKIISVTFNDRLLMYEHVQSIVSASASLLYALRVLRSLDTCNTRNCTSGGLPGNCNG